MASNKYRIVRTTILIVLSLVSQYLFAINPIVRNLSSGVEFRNNHVSIVLSNEAELTSCVELISGSDIAVHDNTKIAWIKDIDGNVIHAEQLMLNNDILSFMIGRNKVRLKVAAYNDYFTFEVLNSDIPGIDLLAFLDIKLKYNFNDPEVFLATAVAMTLQTNPLYYPSGESKAIMGQCTAHTGIKGAKLAVIACKKSNLRHILKTVYKSLPKGTIPVSYAGGAFSLDNDLNRGDCVIVSGESDPKNLLEKVDFYSGLGISQVSFLRGSKTFLSGDYSFPFCGSASAFRKQVVEPLSESGITSLMHTYSYYISYSAKELLSNPRWQQQLEFREVFTLSDELSSTDTKLIVSEDKTALKNDSAFWTVHTPYLLIDKEIIKYTLNQDGFAACMRAQCGTKASAHKRGTKVRIIGGKFSNIAPRIGSELYYEVAHRMARAYNEGGFKGIYFDAIDGLETHLSYAGLKDYYWYYGAAFVNEVLKYCEGEPLVEFSWQFPTIWSARGRCGAWDYPVRGYKNFIDDHIIYNKDFINRFFITTLGWCNFYPVLNSDLGNYSTKYLFFDDVDYLGTKSIAYDQTMVYNGLKEEDIESIPAMRRNLENYSQYNILRKRSYFSEKVLSKLKSGNTEFKLVYKDGLWGFLEAKYCRRKLYNIASFVFEEINPFIRQKPFIRIENMYSSDNSSVIPLMKFIDSQDFSDQSCEKAFSSPIDMSKHLGLRVRIKGNGKKSTDAVCIRLTSSDSGSGVADYIIRLNFDDWRDILLTNLDNAEYPELKFVGLKDGLYTTHRYNIGFSKIRSICVFRSGQCKGVKISRIDAVPLVPNPITNPTVHMGKSSVKFIGTVKSGEYIEYDSDGRTAMVYDQLGRGRSISVKKKGDLVVPSGLFSATVTADSELGGVPTGVTLTFGLYGNFISN